MLEFLECLEVLKYCAEEINLHSNINQQTYFKILIPIFNRSKKIHKIQPPTLLFVYLGSTNYSLFILKFFFLQNQVNEIRMFLGTKRYDVLSKNPCEETLKGQHVFLKIYFTVKEVLIDIS